MVTNDVFAGLAYSINRRPMASENAHFKVNEGGEIVYAVLNFSPFDTEEIASDHRDKDDIP